MNSIEIKGIIAYLHANGITCDKDDSSLLRNDKDKANPPQSRLGMIFSLAQLIKSKSNASAERLSLSIYNQFIAKDNLDLMKTFKKMLTLYQRHLRSALVQRYLHWRSWTVAACDGGNAKGAEGYDHFDFTIVKDTVHDRLYNHYKAKESSRRQLEKDFHASEAENCTFIPTVNHYYTPNGSHIKAKSSKQIIDMTSINHFSPESNSNCYNKHSDKLYYLSTNPNTARITNKSLTNNCMTSSNRKLNTKSSSSRHLSVKWEGQSTSLLPNSSKKSLSHLLNYEATTEGRPYLTNQSSYNNMNHQRVAINKSTSKSSKGNLMSNASSTKTPAGEFLIGSTSRGSIERLSKELTAESLALGYQKRNNKQLERKSNDNSNSINLPVTNYIFHENKRKQHNAQESQLNSKGSQKGMSIVNYPQGNYTSSYKDYLQNKNAIPMTFKKPFTVTPIDKMQYVNKSRKELNSNNTNSVQSNMNCIALNKVSPMQTPNSTKKKKCVFDSIINTNPNPSDPLDFNKNLKITSGVASEYLGAPVKSSNNAMNSVYSNQITLQTISDSKLYDIANHYITTDESLDKYSCISCSYRKCQRHQKR